MEITTTATHQICGDHLFALGWIAELRLADTNVRVIWTPHGAERVLMIIYLAKLFEVDNLTYLESFENGCRGQWPGPPVGEFVGSFWLRTRAELALGEDLGRVLEIFRFIATANH